MRQVSLPADPIQAGASSGGSRSRLYGSIAVGALCGLAWSAGMRGWMAQIAGQDSTFHWLGTFGLLLVPGAVVGALLGWAEHLRRNGSPTGGRRRWLIASPLLLAAAVADPRIFHALITTGLGGGALAVVATGMAGGYALSRRGPVAARAATGLVAVLLMAAAASIRAEDTPVSAAHGAWIAVHITSLLALLCVACSIPHRTLLRPSREGPR